MTASGIARDGGAGLASFGAVDDDRLSRHDKVVAAVDLPGVPAGTPGKVIMEAGLRWFRYWVRFDNGVTLGTIDRAQLARR